MQPFRDSENWEMKDDPCSTLRLEVNEQSSAVPMITTDLLSMENNARVGGWVGNLPC